MTGIEVAAREGWSQRLGFLSAAIGAAVGLGNVWRFPYLTYSYGGGAFFVPYILAMLFIGVPILTLEFALGQVFRSGDLAAFGAIHKRLRGVGMGSIWCGFMVVCYYVIIIAWAATMLVNSFRGSEEMAWAGDPKGFFWNKVVGLADERDAKGNLNRSSRLVPQTWVALTLVWLSIYLCTFKGPKVTGRITYCTMMVPFVLLVALAITFGGLSGASDGIDLYIGQWDFSMLTGGKECGSGGSSRSCVEAWPDAVAQVFFSLGVTFGIMTAYASYNPISQGVQVDAIICAMGDLVTSFIAGFMVFASVGVLGYSTGKGAAAAADGSKGLGLAFISMPAAFNALGEDPFDMSLGLRKFIAVLFFLTLVLLGIDSAFSLCEGFSTCIADSRMAKGVPREALLGVICLVGYAISLGYTIDTGLYSLDAVDYYINVTMLFIGFMECLSAGWVAYSTQQVEKIGNGAWYTALGTMLYASVMAPVVGLGIGGQSDEAEAGSAVGLLFGAVFFLVGMWIACRLAARHAGRPLDRSVVYDVLLSNVEQLRSDINSVCGRPAGNFSVPFEWSLAIKFFCPPVLMTMLTLKFFSGTFGAYENYHQWYQGWGLAVAFAPFLMLAVGLVAPQMYDSLMPEKEYTLDELLGRTTGVGKQGAEAKHEEGERSPTDQATS